MTIALHVRSLFTCLAACLVAVGTSGTATAQQKQPVQPPIIKMQRELRELDAKANELAFPTITEGQIELHSFDKEGVPPNWWIASASMKMGKNEFVVRSGLLGETIGESDFTNEVKKKNVIGEIWFKGGGPGGPRPSPSPVGYVFIDRELLLTSGVIAGTIDIRQDPGKGVYYAKGVQADVLFLKRDAEDIAAGDASAAKGQWLDAEKHYLAVSQRHPKKVDLLHKVGAMRMARKDWKAAAETFEKAVAADPKNAESHSQLAAVRVELNEWDKAETAYREAVRLKPENGETRYRLAVTLTRQGGVLKQPEKWKDAEEHFRAAERLLPGDPDPIAGVGLALLAQRKHADAETKLREAIRLSPQTGWYHVRLAEALWGQGEVDAATAAAREAIRLGERNHEIFELLKVKP